MAVSTNRSAAEQAETTMKQSHQVGIKKQDDTDVIEEAEVGASSGVLNVVISGLGLFSDGYNAQITCLKDITNLRICEVGYMEPLFSVLFVTIVDPTT
ncbi:hypothetical protein AbraIFM66951_009570 [Aspergillus brasiliensis]|uniref:Uncharacterized protein n=1 Tax=Aspergillus brasiliensis TaxID=319629 RepID=A0A9W5Z117_9EURO|nr:hypothetical protein AbraCBS73388_002097 [Aspergillus brasiliensis]GKZ41460.1 hypothetical protein AbraIFM66951_009570 [Aspergillus brasiliensis]